MRGSHSHEILVALAAAFFLVVHLGFGQPVLEDIDSINFALGVTSYDVANHQPHPPGYPVFIALSRGVAAVLRVAGASEPVARALVVEAACAGAIAIWAAWRLLLAAGWRRPDAAWMAVLWSAAPLVWLTAARPLSDLPGLAGALVAQALLLHLATSGERATLLRVAGVGLATGLAVGVRSQVVWLAAPVAVLACIRLWQRDGVQRSGALVVSGLAGVAAWLVPMIVVSGGLDAYLAALDSQASDDFTGVPMLVTSFGMRRLGTALIDTFVHPWGSVTLAVAALALVAVGALRLLWQAPARLATLALLFAPYALFHLLFQETETTRYALPLVLPMVVLLASAVMPGHASGRPRVAPLLLAVTVAAFLGTSLYAHALYRQSGARAVEVFDLLGQAAQARPPDVVLMHRQVWAETRRVRQITPPLPNAPATVPRDHEWRALEPVFDRGSLHAWWLTDPRRGDRGAIDPRSLRRRGWFGWHAPAAWLLGGMRPHPFDWYVIDDPTWMLLDGWALTPELAGLSDVAGHGPGSPAGAGALVRRRGRTQTVLVGGRLFAIPDEPAGPATLTVALGGWRASTTVAPGHFHRVWQVSADAEAPAQPTEGDPPATSAANVAVERLIVRADGGPAVNRRLSLEQFDVQDAGVPVVALGAGWQEPERDPADGRMWRWMTEAASLEVWGAPCALRLRLRGTWPRHYDAAPVLTVRSEAGGELFRGAVSRPFALDLPIPASSAAAPLRLTLGSDRSFVAGERTGTADARRLAIEVSELQVAPASGAVSCGAAP